MAFPNTPILDALQSGSVGANWTTPSLQQSQTGTESAAGAACPTAATAGFYWNPGQFAADQEAYVTWNAADVAANVITLDLRITNPGGASAPNMNAYQLNYGSHSPATSAVFKIVNGTATQIQSFSRSNVGAGDSMGMQVIGTTINLWYQTAAGAWTMYNSFSDSAVSGAGYIGFVVQGTVNRAINFGGGAIGAPASSGGFFTVI